MESSLIPEPSEGPSPKSKDPSVLRDTRYLIKGEVYSSRRTSESLVRAASVLDGRAVTIQFPLTVTPHNQHLQRGVTV